MMAGIDKSRREVDAMLSESEAEVQAQREANQMPRIWTLMTEEQRIRMYRLAAEQRCELDILAAVADDIKSRVEMRQREGRPHG